jgi:flagellin-like protein
MSGKKGISPLIASVLLIAFTISIATLSGPFFSQLLKNAQSGTSEDLNRVQTAAGLNLEIMQMRYNYSSQNLSVTVQNDGDTSFKNISIGVLGGNPKQKIYSEKVAKRGIQTYQFPLKSTYPRTELDVSLTEYLVSTRKKLKCVPAENLVGYWTFNQDQTQGSFAIDKTKYRNNGTIDGATSKEGEVGEAYNFDGDDEVSLQNKEQLDFAGSKSFTLSAWVKGGSSSVNEDIIHLGGYSIVLTNTAGNYWAVYMEDSSSGSTQVDKKAQSNSKWVHLSATYDGSRLGLYVNGEEANSKPVTESVEDHSGVDDFIGSAGGGRYFTGGIDEVRIYNRTLSDSEIKRLYKARSKSWNLNACKMTS